MTLVADRGRDGPRVHVLAIGVGAYRHLPGGSDPVAHDTLGLQQLSGPPLSARLFVDWVSSTMNHPRARLGTIELLTSPGEMSAAESAAGIGVSEAGAAAVDVPTMAAVTQAFEEWYARCNSDEDNVAILYFCGHGVERESAYLLLEDFGRSPHWLLENAFDIGTTYQGMATCRSREQYFFVDACREIPFQLLQTLGGQARSLVTLAAVGDQRRDTALVFATSGGARAYGRTGQPTQFTQALVRALDGLGSRPDSSGWAVDVPSLQRAITVLLRGGEDGAPVQLPSVRGAGVGVLHTFNSPPQVPIVISCTPRSAIPGALVSLSPLCVLPGAVAGGEPPQAVPDSSGWSAEAPADVYSLTVEFPGGEHAPLRKTLPALPPGLDSEHVEVLP